MVWDQARQSLSWEFVLFGLNWGDLSDLRCKLDGSLWRKNGFLMVCVTLKEQHFQYQHLDSVVKGTERMVFNFLTARSLRQPELLKIHERWYYYLEWSSCQSIVTKEKNVQLNSFQQILHLKIPNCLALAKEIQHSVLSRSIFIFVILAIIYFLISSVKVLYDLPFDILQIFIFYMQPGVSNQDGWWFQRFNPFIESKFGNTDLNIGWFSPINCILIEIHNWIC